MTEDFVFPEDQGTNANLTTAGEGDDADAANFASIVEAIGNSDFVVRGLELSNVGNGTFNLSAGKAVVTDATADAAQSDETRDQHVSYVSEVAERLDIAFTEDAVNHVFLDVLLTDDDAVEIVVNTTNEAPDEPSLKIAEIDDT